MSRLIKGARALGRLADRGVDGLAAAETLLSVGLLSLVLITVSAQVIMRYVMNAPLATSDEFVRFTLIWLSFMAAALTQSRDQHIAVLVLRGSGSRLRQQIMDALANVAALATGVVVVLLGAEALRRGSRISSASLEAPMSVVYASVVLGFALIAIHALRNLANLWRFGRVTPETQDGGLSERQQMS